MIKKLLLKFLLLIQTTLVYRFRGVGDGCRLDKNIFVSPNRVTLGRFCYIGRYCYLDGDIVIGDYSLLASSVAIVGGDHAFRVKGVAMRDSGREHWKKTIIGSDVWVGHGAIILNGITVGNGALVGAGSVVTKDVAPYTVVGGNPAKFISNRFA